MKDVRVYVEGGGDKESKARLREAFARFFASVDPDEGRRGARVRFILCGSRNETYEDFLLALRTNRESLNLLLVDAERPVAGTPRAHLQAPAPGDEWDLSAVTDDQCHLMVEVMESWFLGDPPRLAEVYGRDFVAGAIPKTRNIEQVSKVDLLDALKRATRDTQKGEYHKTRHAPQILERLDAAKVRGRAPHCDRLWNRLEQALELRP